MSKYRPSTKSRRKTIATHGPVGTAAARDQATALSAFVETAQPSPETLAGLAEQGISGDWLTSVAIILHVSADTSRHWLGVQSTSRVHRLDRDDSFRVLALVKLIGRVQSIVTESGDLTNFDAGRWMAGFLRNPHPALGSRRPHDYRGAIEGRATVEQLIEQQQSGTHA